MNNLKGRDTGDHFYFTEVEMESILQAHGKTSMAILVSNIMTNISMIREGTRTVRRMEAVNAVCDIVKYALGIRDHLEEISREVPAGDWSDDENSMTT